MAQRQYRHNRTKRHGASASEVQAFPLHKIYFGLLRYAFCMRELTFEVTQEEDGGYCARAIGESIFTQGDTWEELREMVLDATKGYFYDTEHPAIIRLHLIRDEVLAVA
jgi:hypothetical protein